MEKGGSFFARLPERRRFRVNPCRTFVARKRCCCISVKVRAVVRRNESEKTSLMVFNRARHPFFLRGSKVAVLGPKDLSFPHRRKEQNDCVVVRISKSKGLDFRRGCLWLFWLSRGWGGEGGLRALLIRGEWGGDHGGIGGLWGAY